MKIPNKANLEEGEKEKESMTKFSYTNKDNNEKLLLSNIDNSSIQNDLNHESTFPSIPIYNQKISDDKNLYCQIQNITKTTIPLTQRALLSCLRNQTTGKILQKVLMECSRENIEIIVNELKGTFRDIIKDKNGNYFCSDLFKICNQQQRIKILKELEKTISDDCLDEFGNHPIQTLIEFSSSEDEYKLILNSFNDYRKIIFASSDSFGSFVIQKIIEHIPEKFRTNFNLLFISSIPLISMKKYGVCNAKRFISCLKTDQLIEKTADIISQNFIQIATNNFGNFLIQFIFKKWNNTAQGMKIKQEVLRNFKILLENKYSFYICDLFLKNASNDEKIKILEFYKHNN